MNLTLKGMWVVESKQPTPRVWSVCAYVGVHVAKSRTDGLVLLGRIHGENESEILVEWGDVPGIRVLPRCMLIKGNWRLFRVRSKAVAYADDVRQTNAKLLEQIKQQEHKEDERQRAEDAEQREREAQRAQRETPWYLRGR